MVTDSTPPVKKGHQPELLAPAGDWDSLTAAVANGADAVFLGTREFNARINARNFSLEELAKAVEYCHSRGVRVYLALNTLVKSPEVGAFFNVLARAYSIGIDGVIIQHISFLEIIKRQFPGLAVFASTQAAVGNAASASLLKVADRLILPRELTLPEIKKIIATGAHVEVFVHGALCFSYSGLCLFSSLVSNRSGNRGQCAQLCRQKYGGAYPLSTKELCLAGRLPELIEAGIRGFKIEGRMRSPLYVAVATRLYRKAIDSYLAGKFELPGKEMAEIEVVFNREFTEGFVGGGRNMISPEKPMNRGAFLGKIESGEIAIERPIAVGDGVGIWSGGSISGAVVKGVTLAGKKVEEAPAGSRVKLELGVGPAEASRIYLTSSRRIRIQPDFTLVRPPVVTPHRPAVRVNLPQPARSRGTALKWLVKVYSIEEAREAARAGADILFYNIFGPNFPGKDNWQENGTLGAYVPRIMSDDELNQALNLLRRKRLGAILTGNLGLLARRAEFKVPVYMDYSLNTFNDLDVLFFQKHNAVPMLSPELALGELSQIRDKDAVIFCHGDIVLVNSKIEIECDTLRDEKGLAFPVRKEAGYWQVLNSLPFGLFSDISKLRHLGFAQFFIDLQGEGARWVSFYRDMLRQEIPDRRLRRGYTSGHLYRPVA